MDVFFVPRIEQTLAVSFALGLQQHPSIVFQAALGGFEKSGDMALPNLLKRANADNAIELGFAIRVELPKVTELELHRQMTRKPLS